MRDHPAQMEVILGGLWGTKLPNNKIRSNWKESWIRALKDKLLWARRDSYGPDQHFLLKYICTNRIELIKIQFFFKGEELGCSDYDR